MTTKITVKDNGSIRVEGEFELLDAAGNKFDLGGRSAISLCRCGEREQTVLRRRALKCGFQSQIVAFALPAK